MKLLGIVGKAGAGKDTLADYLIDEKGYYDTRMAFADALKETCARVFSIPYEYFVRRDKKNEMLPDLGKTPRQVLQTVGTMMREVDPSCWTKLLAYDIDRTLRTGRSIIVTDVRFIEEANMIAGKGGKLVKIVKTGEYELEGETAKHASEVELDSPEMDLYIDYWIRAAPGDLGRIYEKAEEIMKYMKELNDRS